MLRLRNPARRIALAAAGLAALIVAHNMASPPPDPDYVKAVTTDPALDTVFLNMDAAGVGVTLKKR